MKWMTPLVFAGLMAAAELGSPATAAPPPHRQYYSSWIYYPSGGYYYRYYYYKPHVSYDNYHYHYCTYYPSRPRYVYYYNPYSKVYWGRLDLEAKGDDRYSLLKEEDRKEKLEDIDESKFPSPGKMPAIPESKDGVAIEPPPNDLPKK